MRFPCVIALLVALATPVQAADFGLLLPERSIVDNPRQNTLKLTLGAVDPFWGRGIPIERPQAFSVLRRQGDVIDRSEHLSVLEEITAYGAKAWSTRINLPMPGVYHFIMQSKAIWQPEENRFTQYSVKVQVPVHGSSEGWDMPLNTGFEILPLSRPFGMYTGMSFTGQILHDGKPVSGALVAAARLDPAAKINAHPPVSNRPKGKNTPNTLAPFYAVQEVKADQQGIFTFTCPLSGWWGFATDIESDPLKDPSGNVRQQLCRAEFWVYFEDRSSNGRR